MTKTFIPNLPSNVVVYAKYIGKNFPYNIIEVGTGWTIVIQRVTEEKVLGVSAGPVWPRPDFISLGHIELKKKYKPCILILLKNNVMLKIGIRKSAIKTFGIALDLKLSPRWRENLRSFIVNTLQVNPANPEVSISEDTLKEKLRNAMIGILSKMNEGVIEKLKIGDSSELQRNLNAWLDEEAIPYYVEEIKVIDVIRQSPLDQVLNFMQKLIGEAHE